MADKNLRDEVAELTEAVHELRDREVAEEIGRLREEIAALRAGQGCTGCHGHCCGHWHWYCTPAWTGGAAGYPGVYYTTHTVTGGNSSAIAGSGSYVQNYANTACAGGNQTFSVSLT